MRREIGLLIGVGLLAMTASAAEAGCPCPKQKNAEMYGTVSAIVPKTSPILPPKVATAPELAERRVARGELPHRLPLATPASDQMSDIIAIELAAAE